MWKTIHVPCVLPPSQRSLDLRTQARPHVTTLLFFVIDFIVGRVSPDTFDARFERGH